MEHILIPLTTFWVLQILICIGWLFIGQHSDGYYTSKKDFLLSLIPYYPVFCAIAKAIKELIKCYRRLK